MKVYVVTMFSEEGKGHQHQWPQTKVFLNKEEAYKFYEDIELHNSAREIARDNGTAHIEGTICARPRGKLIQAHDVSE